MLFNDHLRESVNLRAYAQKDPLVEYKKEAFGAFTRVNELIRAETIEKILKVRLVARDETEEELRSQRRRKRPSRMEYQGSEASGEASALNQMPMGQAPSPGNMPPGFPAAGEDEGPKLNRAQRRAMKKKRR